ncbi:hypothetical protein [Calorimonas adulescens]|jgi:hypothetical protein|uniref:DUF2508 family protein n=1 Tax=Calorimonas adulescens TaxID=2606906 RepID=A0A5D8QC97_9THEO|nr:hypothetical protein [Calorimonas adulescens]TZE81729.1 hypothetical protein FWJ32_08320 [Calorimonas adulescens]
MDREKLLLEIDDALKDMKLAEEKLEEAKRRYQFASERYRFLLKKAREMNVKWDKNKLYLKLIQEE